MNEVAGLDKEIAELKEFIADLKADRAAQKDKERREAWTKYISISLVFIAVLAAIATQYGGKYSGRVLVNLNDATFNQAKASDQWSYYQAKSIKQNLYEALRELSAKPADGSNTKHSDDAFAAKIAKYEADKAQVKREAEGLEQLRDKAREAAGDAARHGGGMGTAIETYQIAIALGSMCLITKKRPLWYISIGLAAVATVKMLFVITH